MKKRTISVLLGLLLPLSACNPNPKPTPEPVPRPRPAALALEPTATQPFDFYLLNLSWSPEFCYSHPNATECAQHPTFVLHGLWPQNTTGPFPQHCSNAPGPRDPSNFSDLYPDAGLLRHEWQTHGTCSGLSPEASSRQRARPSARYPSQPTDLPRPPDLHAIPARSSASSPGSQPVLPSRQLRPQLRQQLPHRDRSLHEQALQPVACGPIRSCRANTVRIVPPQGASAN